MNPEHNSASGAGRRPEPVANGLLGSARIGRLDRSFEHIDIVGRVLADLCSLGESPGCNPCERCPYDYAVQAGADDEGAIDLAVQPREVRPRRRANACAVWRFVVQFERPEISRKKMVTLQRES